MNIIDLIRQEIVKVRGQIAGIAKLVVDDDEKIRCKFINTFGLQIIILFITYFVLYRYCQIIFCNYCRQRKYSL